MLINDNYEMSNSSEKHCGLIKVASYFKEFLHSAFYQNQNRCDDKSSKIHRTVTVSTKTVIVFI